MKRIGVNKYFWNLEPICFVLLPFFMEYKAKFQLDVSDNKDVIFPQPVAQSV